MKQEPNVSEAWEGFAYCGQVAAVQGRQLRFICGHPSIRGGVKPCKHQNSTFGAN